MARDRTAALASCSRSRRCSWSRRRLTLVISPPPLVLNLSHPLTQPRATAPLSSSLSLTPTVKFWSTGCFSFSPYFHCDLVSIGFLVWWCELYEVLIFIHLYLLCFWVVGLLVWFVSWFVFICICYAIYLIFDFIPGMLYVWFKDDYFVC